MWSFLSIAVIASFVVFTSASNASDRIEKSIPAGQVHEECMELGTKKKLTYSFNSPKPMNFNIHYHVGKDVFYPIKRNKVSSLENEFRPISKQEYCLMWSNLEKVSVRLSYTFKVE